MNRLTKIGKNGMYGLAKVQDNEQVIESSYPNTLRAIAESFQLLAAYEDTGLTPDDVAALRAELDALKADIEAGRLVRLPCKPGDSVYWHWCDGAGKPDGEIVEDTVMNLFFDKGGVGITSEYDGRLGHYEMEGTLMDNVRRVYLSKEAARDALEGGQHGSDQT